MNEIPRRCCVTKLTAAELKIRDAVAAVEEMGCDTRLTEAVVLLQQAREQVADFVDGWTRPTEAAVLRAELDACKEYLKDGETVAECIARNRGDVETALKLLASEKFKAEELHNSWCRKYRNVLDREYERVANAHAELADLREELRLANGGQS